MFLENATVPFALTMFDIHCATPPLSHYGITTIFARAKWMTIMYQCHTLSTIGLGVDGVRKSRLFVLCVMTQFWGSNF